MTPELPGRGPIAWMARNPVAANLLMLSCLVAGLSLAPQIRQEVFPEFELDVVAVQVAYPGASPSEVEQGVLLAIEEAVRGIDGVKEVRAIAREGTASILAELLTGADADRALADVKSAVGRITSFPVDVERPVVSLVSNRAQVVSLVVYGDVEEGVLRRLAEEARATLLLDPRITTAELSAVRPLEISIEVSQQVLRQYGLTLSAIVDKIRQAAVEIPGGGVKTARGEVLLRTSQRRYVAADYEEIPIITDAAGLKVLLRDIADIRDGFAETDAEAFFNGQRAAMVSVYRVGEQTPIEVAAAVRAFADAYQARLPDGVSYAIWADRSEIYSQRMDLLLRNAYLGLALVLLTLWAFLELRLAMWVALGIPISFIGAIALMPLVDVSFNMISLFAFIITLGIVVDDAIIVGEAAFLHREEGLPPLQAAILGCREVAKPVVFAVLTSVIAFSPMLVVPGASGKFFRVVPLIVISVLALSLLESLFILPAHLGHSRNGHKPLLRSAEWVRRRVSGGLEHFLKHRYTPFLRAALEQRWLTAATCIAVFLVILGLPMGGHIRFTFLPKIDSDRVVATLEMPYGTPVRETRQWMKHMVTSLRDVMEDAEGEAVLSRGIFSEVGGTGAGFGAPRGESRSGGSHLAQVALYLVPSDQRQISARELAAQWRRRIGEIPGAETLKFRASTGPGADVAMSFELSHPDVPTLEKAAGVLGVALRRYAGISHVDDGFALGKEELQFRLLPSAAAAGMTERLLAQQVRDAFFGHEAIRQQRGRDEVRTYVRLPRAERRSEYNVEGLMLRTPAGHEVPLSQVARVERQRSFTEIQRVDGRRVLRVEADIEPGRANANEIVRAIQSETLPVLSRDFAGLGFRLVGKQESQRETLTSLRTGGLIALVAIFALLAVAFHSYVQPIIIMSAIPFGFVGAVLGHMLMGYDLSLISVMGLVALSGVVVNDSLVLVVAINARREEGATLHEAIIDGGVRRFRPILLTSLTTFFGLTPMILETSLQARFLIPMAISLGFGVLFATVIILILVPVFYTFVEDMRVLRK